MGLTLNLLYYMGLPADAVPRAVLPVWRSDHLHVAEVLVTALASSLIALDGFNATDAGGTSGSASADVLKEQKKHVLAVQH